MLLSQLRLQDPNCRTFSIDCGAVGDSGVRLKGGRGNGIFIKSITSGSPASQCGLLRVEDEVVGVSV